MSERNGPSGARRRRTRSLPWLPMSERSALRRRAARLRRAGRPFSQTVGGPRADAARTAGARTGSTGGTAARCATGSDRWTGAPARTGGSGVSSPSMRWHKPACGNSRCGSTPELIAADAVAVCATARVGASIGLLAGAPTMSASSAARTPRQGESMRALAREPPIKPARCRDLGAKLGGQQAARTC
jgi:hypothetical protein